MSRKTNRILVTTKEEINQINETNRELMEDYINYLEATDHSPASIKVYKSNLNIFFVYMVKFLKNKNFADLKKRDIINFQNYLIKNGLSPARIRVLRSTLSSLSIYIENVLDEEEMYEDFHNLILKIPAPNLNHVREKTVISDEELEYLLKTLIERDKIQLAALVAFAAFSGARRSELVQYKLSFFNEGSLKNGLYITPEIRTKGQGIAGKMLKKYCIKSKVQPYLDLLIKYREDKGINVDDLFVVKSGDGYRAAKSETVAGWMKICSEILGKPVYCHSFRHLFVSMLVRQNIPINVVKDIVGHNDSSTTELYNDNPKEDGFMKYFGDNGVQQVESKSLNDL